MNKPVNNLLDKLMNSALASDALAPHGFRRVVEPKAAVFVATGGKSKRQIVRDAARQLRKAGMLKEPSRSQQIK